MAEEEKKVEAKAEIPSESGKESPEAAPAVEEKKEEAPGVEVEMTADQKKFVDSIEKMTVMDLNNLVKVFEKKFGVSAAAVAAPAGGGGGDAAAEEKDSFDVELSSAGEQKIQVIKAIKDILGLGLKDAKDMVDGAPVMLKEGLKKDEAEEIQKKIEAAGGGVTLK